MVTAVARAPNDLVDAAHDLLPLARDAARTLARGKEVPADLPAVIDKLHEAMPSPDRWSGIDGYLVAALSQGVTRCYRALQKQDASTRSELRIGLEQIQQALTYLIDEQPADPSRSTQEIVRWLLEVTSASRAELASLLGVSPSTIGRWASGSSPSIEDETRLRIVAGIVANLRHSLTAPGVLLWLTTPHPDLDGDSPAERFDEPNAFQQLVRLASRTRSSAAT